jgi:hypothetical protein
MTTDVKNFESQLGQYQALITQERLSKEEVIRKKQYVEICSLKLEHSNYKYSEIAKLLNVTNINQSNDLFI